MIGYILTRLLPPHQNLFGFLRGKLTSDAIGQFIINITDGRKSNFQYRTTAVTFFDLDEAFKRAQSQAFIESLITGDYKR